MDMKVFLRESIKENEKKAQEYLLEERKKQFYKLSLNNGLPIRFRDKTLKNFDGGDNALAYERACSFVNDFPNTEGLLLSGDVGVGKTHLAAGIVNELNRRLYSTYFGNVVDIISFFKSTYNKNSQLTERELIHIITKRVDLLIIDDLGKENNTDHNLALLYQIINQLYENEKPIIITTNYNSVDLSTKLGERGQAISSRITAMCIPVQFKGRDRRF